MKRKFPARFGGGVTVLLASQGITYSTRCTTTELDLQCISERKGKARSNIEVAARNDMPDFLCDECGKPAKEICSECLWEGKGLLCESCAEDHECGEEMLLPVVNSPRMGECAYTG